MRRAVRSTILLPIVRFHKHRNYGLSSILCKMILCAYTQINEIKKPVHCQIGAAVRSTTFVSWSMTKTKNAGNAITSKNESMGSMHGTLNFHSSMPTIVYHVTRPKKYSGIPAR